MAQLLDKTFWDDKYYNNTTGWDMGVVANPFKTYVDQLKNKSLRILTPGGGNSYEASYLVENGYANVSIVDISSIVTDRIKERFKGNQNIGIYNEDFFSHHGEYDLIFEQTFFCALNLDLREQYVNKMHELLAEDGSVFGVLFDREFSQGPPFGGNEKSYRALFEKKFNIEKLEPCYNSHPARQGSELWIKFRKK